MSELAADLLARAGHSLIRMADSLRDIGLRPEWAELNKVKTSIMQAETDLARKEQEDIPHTD